MLMEKIEGKNKPFWQGLGHPEETKKKTKTDQQRKKR